MENEEFRQFIEAVREMRNLQREYFDTRQIPILNAAKQAERRVDRMLESLADDSPKLF